MIFGTGDCHGNYERFEQENFPQQDNLTKEDYVIVAGDFGGVWYKPDSPKRQAEDRKLDELDRKPFTTLWVPGNHENYARLMSDEFEEKEWHGGRVKVIRPSVLMLNRGEMYEIDGKKVFAFGGARSHDIHDGLFKEDDPELEQKIRELHENGKLFYRIDGINWWKEELPTQDELDRGWETLEKHDWQCDLVVTHCAATNLQYMLGFYEADILTDWLERVRSKLDYKKWIFGHYHNNQYLTKDDILLYTQIYQLF